MPRIIRAIHEYYEPRIVRGLYAQVVNDGAILRILPGAAVINEQLISVMSAKDFVASQFIIDKNVLPRTDILILNTEGNILHIAGTPGEIAAPRCPNLSLLLAQVNIAKGWTKFVGTGAWDEVLSIRSQHVIDTRFDIA